MSNTMLAMRFEAWGEDAKLREVPIPRPETGGVLVKVTAAGMCHSDLHLMEASVGYLPFEPPFTLGHEVAGTVVELGADVDSRWLGTNIVVHGIWGCGECRRCRAGRQNYCLRRTGGLGNGLGYDGGMAEYMVVPSVDYLVSAEGVDPIQAAPLTDAALTAFHAVKPHVDSFDENSKVLVIGAGGLGHFAVQLLARTKAQIIVVDPKSEARHLAKSLGAHEVYENLDLVLAGIETLEDRFDVVYDFVAATVTMGAGVSLLAPGGHLQIIGAAGGELKIGKFLGLPQGWTLSAPFWGPKPDLITVVEMARAKTLTAHTETFRLSEAESAYERLRNGEVSGRAVILPHS